MEIDYIQESDLSERELRALRKIEKRHGRKYAVLRRTQTTIDVMPASIITAYNIGRILGELESLRG